jgi:hypothetical protein
VRIMQSYVNTWMVNLVICMVDFSGIYPFDDKLSLTAANGSCIHNFALL